MNRKYKMLLRYTAGYFAGFLISCCLLHSYMEKGRFDAGAAEMAKIFFLLCVAAAVEEFLFRKFILDVIVKCFAGMGGRKVFFAVILQAFLFALAHIKNAEVASADCKFAVLLSYFAGGVYFAYLRCRTDSLSVPVIVHVFNNLLSTFVVKSRYSSLSGDISFFMDTVRPDSLLMLVSVLIPIVCSVAAVETKLSKSLEK